MDIQRLKQIAQSDSWHLRNNLNQYIAELEKEQKGKPVRTDSQHKALFLWFSMIEKMAEEQGVTWDMLIRHVNQLKVTKANLHDIWKQLQKVLCGTSSTKQLKKQEEIDMIRDHFIDLFAKEGMELPDFPCDEKAQAEKLGRFTPTQELIDNYPKETYEPKF
jgi:hypothetical protein